MNSNILLSLCIPTYKRMDSLICSLESIVKQDIFTNSNCIEVVISDNDPDSELLSFLTEKYLIKYQGKIKYYKNDKNYEDYNFLLALSRANGRFLKLSNDTLIYKKGMLDILINFLKELEEDTFVFLMNDPKSKINIYDNARDFLKDISYWVTWIGGFCIHRNYLTVYSNLNDLNYASHLSQVTTVVKILVRYNFNKYISFHYNFADTYFKSVSGNYNLIEVFSKNYICIINELKENNIFTSSDIKNEAFKVLRKHILPRFFNLHDNYFYDLDNFWENTSFYHKYPYFYFLITKFYLKSKFYRMRQLFRTP